MSWAATWAAYTWALPARIDRPLSTRRGHGPEVAGLPAIVVARQLAAGALPCVGLISLAAFGEAGNAAHLDIAWQSFLN